MCVGVGELAARAGLAALDGVGDAAGVLDGPLGAEDPPTGLHGVQATSPGGLLLGLVRGLDAAHFGHGTSLRLALVGRPDMDRNILHLLSQLVNYLLHPPRFRLLGLSLAHSPGILPQSGLL